MLWRRKLYSHSSNPQRSSNSSLNDLYRVSPALKHSTSKSSPVLTSKRKSIALYKESVSFSVIFSSPEFSWGDMSWIFFLNVSDVNGFGPSKAFPHKVVQPLHSKCGITEIEKCVAFFHDNIESGYFFFVNRFFNDHINLSISHLMSLTKDKSKSSISPSSQWGHA